MCGIAGIVAPKSFDPKTLVEMTQLIQYRGPDGYGFAFASGDGRRDMEVIHNQDRLPLDSRPTIGLGNRRLAILDVSTAGSQPMQTEDGVYTITFNGEIYNYKEIREELKQAGISFRSHTDTEVILRAYQQWGEECLQHFNGMWAFAIWDRVRQRLFCARDRLGVKPFYYTMYDGCFFFASEIKQILQATGMPRIANSTAVVHFLEWALLDYSDETFFDGIRQLPGGSYLTLDLPQLNLQIRRYWDLQTGPELELKDGEAIEQFRDLFSSSVRLRLRSDVPVGISLSGGLDSSSVVCEARKVSPETELRTFSACFEDPEIDEREYVSAVVREVQGTSHLAFPQGPAFWKSLENITYHQDEPVGSPGVYAQWCVMAEAREHGVPVILGGQGGDETLCGYQKYQFFHWLHLLRQRDPRFLSETFRWLRGGTSSGWSPSAISRYLPAQFRRTFSTVNRIGARELKQLAQDVRPSLGPGQTVAERQKTDLVYSSIPALLHHEDRTAMAHSVESRLPFLDYRLVEFLLRCPTVLKLRDGWSKWLLRNALADTLPEKIRLRRTKLGFNTPEKKWMRHGLQNGYRRVWDASGLRMQRYIDPAKFREECQMLVNGSPRGLSPGTLFRAVSLETWANVFSVN
ncbi:MAG TPA: asparagine synthase (glutamine-hydrolyzing) [Candidatus Dormibacteraeota bacterium]|nr:asparagine synthase (glutamine-hydrolyzing) [Candidatus Dormibacteraeota bacterium]